VPEAGRSIPTEHAQHRPAGQNPSPGDRGQLPSRVRPKLPLQVREPGRPADPADTQATLLLAAGADAQQIPPGVEARAARWRDHLMGKKILLMLDNAAEHEQVGPLLPGTAGSLMLIASRRRLAAPEDAAVIGLDTSYPR
jgi:hypothetical protein